jgi:hypothetical protein
MKPAFDPVGQARAHNGTPFDPEADINFGERQ